MQLSAHLAKLDGFAGLFRRRDARDPFVDIADGVCGGWVALDDVEGGEGGGCLGPVLGFWGQG